MLTYFWAGGKTYTRIVCIEKNIRLHHLNCSIHVYNYEIYL